MTKKNKNIALGTNYSIRDAVEDLMKEVATIADEEGPSLVGKPSMEEFVAVKWKAAWRLLMPKDGKSPNPVPLALLLRKPEVPLSIDFREQLADLLDPSSFGSNYRLLCVDDTADSKKQFKSFQETLKRVEVVVECLKAGKNKSTAVREAADKCASNEKSVWDTLKIFEKSFPEIASQMNLSPKTRSR